MPSKDQRLGRLSYTGSSRDARVGSKLNAPEGVSSSNSRNGKVRPGSAWKGADNKVPLSNNRGPGSGGPVLPTIKTASNAHNTNSNAYRSKPSSSTANLSRLNSSSSLSNASNTGMMSERGGSACAAAILAFANNPMPSASASVPASPFSPPRSRSPTNGPGGPNLRGSLSRQGSHGGLGAMPSTTSWPPEGSTEGGEEEDDALPHVLGRERTSNRAARGSGRGGGVQGAAQLAVQAGDDSNAADALAAGAIAACQASGVCELALKGITALPSMLLRYFKAEGCLLQELRLPGNRLPHCPRLELLAGLSVLDLSSNLLTEVPDSLGQLSRLVSLALCENQLQTLPPSLGSLTVLTRLDVSNNPLAALPHSIGRLQRLVELRLDHCTLGYLPSSLACLPRLAELHAAHNALSALPKDIGSLRALRLLRLHHNHITALPLSIGELCTSGQGLLHLELHNNELSILPRELARLSCLTKLTTGCNPLTFPPPPVCRQGLQAIRYFLMGNTLQQDATASAPLPPTPSSAHHESVGCAMCTSRLDELDTLRDQLAAARDALERGEATYKHLVQHAAKQEAEATSLSHQVHALEREKLASERHLHGRASSHAQQAETLATQLQQREDALTRAQQEVTALREERDQAHAALAVERARSSAAAQAAGNAERVLEAAQREAVRARELQAALTEAQRTAAAATSAEAAALASADSARSAADSATARAAALQAQLSMTQRDHSVALCEAQHAQAAAEGRERNTLRELDLLHAALDALQAERRYLDEAAAAGRRVSASASLAPGGVDGGGLGDGANGQAITAPTPYAEQLAQGRSSGSGSGGSGGWRLAQRV